MVTPIGPDNWGRYTDTYRTNAAGQWKFARRHVKSRRTISKFALRRNTNRSATHGLSWHTGVTGKLELGLGRPRFSIALGLTLMVESIVILQFLDG